MKTYKLDPKQLPKQKRSILLIYGITGLIMLLITLYLNQRRAEPTSALWLVPLILGMVAYSGVRAYRQRKQLWEDYTLMVDEAGLTQEQPGYPRLTIPRAELVGMQEKSYGLLLSSLRGRNIIQIPRELASSDFLELKTLLQGWLSSESAVSHAASQPNPLKEPAVLEPTTEKPLDEDQNGEPGSESTDAIG